MTVKKIALGFLVVIGILFFLQLILLLFCLFVISGIGTNGIALVIWIPIFILMGKAALRIGPLFAKITGQKIEILPSESPGGIPEGMAENKSKLTEAKLTNQQKAARDYIIKARRFSRDSDENIKAVFRSMGWLEEDVKKAFESIY